jgi:S1-C subfamily serine protease
MLPPPRNPTPLPVPDPPSASNPASSETSFVSQSEASDDDGFFSDLVGSAAAPTASPGPSPAGSGSSISKTHRPSPKNPKAKNRKLIWITTGGITAGVVALLAALMIFSGNPTPQSDSAANSGVLTHLVFDWPENERLGAKLEIDGTSREIPLHGSMDFELPTGYHRIALRRLGNPEINQTVLLKDGERFQFKPEWKKTEPSGAPGAVAAAAAPADVDMLVTDALPELKHWSTDIEAAKRHAASENKDLFLVFFGPDNRQWCLQLAADLLINKEFRKYADKRFELVLLEAPTAASTEDGKGIGQAATVAQLAADYAVDSFPTIVLTDPEGMAYDREEYKQLSVVEHLQKFSTALAIRQERDKLFAPTETGSDAERVAAAELALQWLQKNDLTNLYAAKIHSWLELAEKVDPKNDRGECESFFLAELGQRLHGIRRADPQQIRSVIQFLDEWTKAGRKFKSGNAGAAAYLNVANLLFEAGEKDDAVKYVQFASEYHPTDPELRGYLDELQDVTSAPAMFGSGFVFAPGGYILTNNHVIAGKGTLFVRIPGNKQEFRAEVVDTSPQLDVAVIKVTSDMPPVKPLSLATATLQRGTEVACFGYPLGKEDVVFTQGPVSALPSAKEPFYMLDLRVNPGNSGGPLVDMRGVVVGIVSAKTISHDETVDSYGLAIPSQLVAEYIKQLTSSIPDYQPLSAEESAKLPEFDKFTKVDSIVSPAVVQIINRRD